jgi:transcriptional regulator with XRE-family HTH domain
MRQRNSKMAERMAILGMGINDVAAEAGISRLTVSRAFNRRGKVHPETAERIAGVLGVPVGEIGIKTSTPYAGRNE